MGAMQELETKTLDAKREMAVADALDEIRTRNARNERMGKDGAEVTVARESTTKKGRGRIERTKKLLDRHLCAGMRLWKRSSTMRSTMQVLGQHLQLRKKRLWQCRHQASREL